MKTLVLAIAAATLISPVAYGAGFANYFAVLAANGTVSTSSGVQSSTHTGTGVYEVNFHRNIAGCAMTATVNGTRAGFAITRRSAAKTIVVSTFSSGGAATNLPVTLQVNCNS